MKRCILSLSFVLLAFLAPSASRADALYTITDVGGSDASLNFTFDSKTGLIPTGSIGGDSSCSNNGIAAACAFYTNGYTGIGYDVLGSSTSAFPIGYLVFNSGSFSSYGTYYSIGIQGALPGAQLVVSNTAPIAATPEPSSFALLGTGALGLLGMARRRFVARAS